MKRFYCAFLRRNAIKKGGITKLLAFSLFLTISALTTDAKAQCTVQCNPDIEISLFNRLDLTITPEMVVFDPYQNCPGASFEIKVYDNQGNHTGDFVNHTMLNEAMTLEAININNGMNCLVDLKVVDELAPQIGCIDIYVSCGDSIQPAQIGFPTVSDNISLLTQSDLFYSEQLENFPCLHTVNGNAVTSVVHRNWKAIDGSGNLGNCVQEIYFLRKTLTDVVFPLDRDGFDAPFLQCGSDNPNDLSVAGAPTIDDNPLNKFHNCEIAISYSDDIQPVCGGEERILRHWKVTDYCIDSSLNHVQVIRLKDVIAPTIEVADTLTFRMDVNKCGATITLPNATLTDNCSSATESILWSYGMGVGPYSDISQGYHSVTYNATDDCGNTSTQTLIVLVEDTQEPTAVCDLSKELSLLNDGTSTVNASTFDDGSHDNCGIATVEISRDGEPYNQQITFTCDDMEEPVPVILKVTDVNGFENTCDVNVSVVDNIKPQLTCPAAVLINCTDDANDTQITGFPITSDNCMIDTVTYADNIRLNACGVGSIDRHWTTRDNSGNERSCIQSITIEDNTNISVVFPDDFTSYECNADFNPNITGRPVINGENCEDLDVDFIDEIFNDNHPACQRIVRTWTIIDGCVYQGGTDGKWEEKQTIELIDSIAPELITMADVIVGAGNFECEGIVTMNNMEATDCSSNISITNDSPFANSNGNNASGTYPIGTHFVNFTARDGCGNSSQATLKITVEDNKPPTPVCNRGISLSLNSDGTVAIHTSIVSNGVWDNCSASGTIQMEVSPNVFTCGEVGDQTVTLTAIDESGNSGFCTTIVTIQDNLDICNVDENIASIAGKVQTVSGQPAVQVLMGLTGGVPRGIQTNTDGSYRFEGLPKDEDYTVLPTYDVDIDEGVTTLDLVLATKHVLNVARFTSPYQWIAADANRSGTISTLDIVAIRKVVLKVESSFPNNTSWRFVDANHIFPEDTNPLNGFVPEAVNINNLAWSHLNTDFVAVKVGDVNGNATLNSAGSIEDRTNFRKVKLVTENQYFEKNETVIVPIKVENAEQISGFQMTIEFDRNALQWNGIESSEFIEMSNGNTGQTNLEDGFLTISWNSENEISIPKNGVLFNLKFNAKRESEIGEVLTINSKYIAAESYAANGNDFEIKVIDFNIEKMEEQGIEIAAYPNPFHDETNLVFQLQNDADVKLTLYNLSGKQIIIKSDFFKKGKNEWRLNPSDFRNHHGVIGYRLITNTGQAKSGKLVRMKH